MEDKDENMEVKINVDDNMLKDVVENGLKSFPKEELYEIAREIIVEAPKEYGTIKELFLEPPNSYGYEAPTEILKLAAKNINLSPAYKEIQDKMINELKENYRTILENVLLDAMCSGLSDKPGFQSSVREGVYRVLQRR